jgi:hypothetical protein
MAGEPMWFRWLAALRWRVAERLPIGSREKALARWESAELRGWHELAMTRGDAR